MQDRACLVAAFTRELSMGQVNTVTLEAFFAMTTAQQNAAMLPWLQAKQTTVNAQITSMQTLATQIAARIDEID